MLVPRAGLEPATSGLGILRSVLMSYRSNFQACSPIACAQKGKTGFRIKPFSLPTFKQDAQTLKWFLI